MQTLSAPAYTWSNATGTSTSALSTTNYDLRSAFGCSGLTDYNQTTATSLPTTISFPDSTNIALDWEKTPGFPADRTGRLQDITLRTGGTINYDYNPTSASNDGLNCSYLVPVQVRRTTSDGTTTYSVAFVTSGGSCSASAACSTTTVLDPGANKTVYSFSAGWGAAAPVTLALTEVQTYQNTGTIASPAYSTTATTTDYICYNATAYNSTPSTCATASVSLPVSSQWTYHEVGASKPSLQLGQFDGYGDTTYSAQYDFGATTPTFQTTITYGTWNGSMCAAWTGYVQNKACEILKQDGSRHTLSDTRMSYSSTGNLLSRSVFNGTIYIGQTSNNTYNTNGTPLKTYDVANNETDYTYSSTGYSDCGTLACSSLNLVFPTKVKNMGSGLSTQATWDATGGVKLTDVDASGNTTTYGYDENCGTTGDPFWRAGSVTDPLGNQHCVSFLDSSDEVQTSFSFNSGSSVNNTTTQTDGFGRLINKQVQEGPSSSAYDTVSTAYSWPSAHFQTFTSIPCSTTAGSNCTSHGVTTLYDILNRPTTVTESGANGVTTYGYTTPASSATKVDVLTTRGPAPVFGPEHTKQVQNEYDGLGRLNISCGILSTGGTSCGEANTASGIPTTFTYTTAVGSSKVTATRASQTRSTTFDPLGRVIQSTTPEGGTTYYYYDTTAPACSGLPGEAHAGLLTCTVDANGTETIYSYDSMNRLTDIGTSVSGSTCRRFRYDNTSGVTGTIPTGITLANQYGRMVEAETDDCTYPVTTAHQITDEWFAYDADGNTTDMWESAPNSGTYYHSVATFFGNGKINTIHLAKPNLYTQTYGLEGEGRWNSLSTTAGSGTTIVSSTSYNPASQTTNVAIGSGTDYDGYVYDPDTARMTNWTFQVGTTPKQETTLLTWNPIGSLKSLAITDGFNSGGTQTCNLGSATNMGYDDLNRLVYDDCGPGGWGQSFSYDQYNNLTKNVISGRTGITFNPGYNTANNQFASGSGATYDARGDLTKDPTTGNVYGWNEFNKLKSIQQSGTNCATSGECMVYDALGRMVEIDSGSTKTEILYTQLGKTGYLNGTTLNYAYWPTPGGGTLLQSGTFYYEHKDWLGSARISSSMSELIVDDRAFAPYGELYATFGSTAQNETIFTGDTQDILSGMMDTPNREYNSAAQGRWLSPDPAGAAWNLYAYATNPNSFVDPLGLNIKDCVWYAGTAGCVPCPYCGAPPPPGGGGVFGASGNGTEAGSGTDGGSGGDDGSGGNDGSGGDGGSGGNGPDIIDCSVFSPGCPATPTSLFGGNNMYDMSVISLSGPLWAQDAAAEKAWASTEVQQIAQDNGAYAPLNPPNSVSWWEALTIGPPLVFNKPSVPAPTPLLPPGTPMPQPGTKPPPCPPLLKKIGACPSGGNV